MPPPLRLPFSETIFLACALCPCLLSPCCASAIPLIGICDTNCDPEELDYVIPGNDDAIRAVKLIVSKMADAVIEAKQGTADVDGEIEAESEEFAATEE